MNSTVEFELDNVTNTPVGIYITHTVSGQEVPATKNCSGLSIGNRFLQDTELCEPIRSAPLAIVSGIVATAIIVGNMLVILAILRGSSRFHRPMYWLIIHLSCADLIVGLMLLWNYCLASLLNIHNTITSLMVIFCAWVASNCSSSIGFVLLAIDRYIQIFYKSLHRTYVTRVTVGLAIFFAWMLPVMGFGVLPIAFNWSCKEQCKCIKEEYMQCDPISECSQILPPFNKSYTLGVALVMFLFVPWPVLIYGMIFVKVRRKTHAIKHSHKRHDLRLIRTLVVILVVFIATLTPLATLLLFDYAIETRNEFMIDCALYLFVLAFLNSMANPLLYMWRMSAIRRSIRQRVFYCFWNGKNGQNGQSRRDITSFQSDQRSPTVNRHNNNNEEEQRFIDKAHNMPLAAVLCLRQMKRGRYTNSHTSTPLSERSNHPAEEEEMTIRYPKEPAQEPAAVPIIAGEDCHTHNCSQKFECEITEL